jgi:hypothetical protein
MTPEREEELLVWFERVLRAVVQLDINRVDRLGRIVRLRAMMSRTTTDYDPEAIEDGAGFKAMTQFISEQRFKVEATDPIERMIVFLGKLQYSREHQ